MNGTTTTFDVFVGVDLDGREVVALTRDQAALVGTAYVIAGRFDRTDPQYSRIVLDGSDDSPLGEKALRIALDASQQGIGLGWTFVTECGYCGGHTTSTTECSSCGIRP